MYCLKISQLRFKIKKTGTIYELYALRIRIRI